jgi:chromate transporter
MARRIIEGPEGQDPPVRRPGILGLFFGFSGMALLSFGGALPVVYRSVVEQRRWVSDEEFSQIWTMCQIMPGANILNFAIFVGRRFAGLVGAIAGALGMVVLPFTMAVSVAAVYAQFGDRPEVQGGLHGIAAAAAGLVFATAFKLARPLVRPRALPGFALAFLSFAGLVIWRLPLPVVFLALAPIGIWLERRGKP